MKTFFTDRPYIENEFEQAVYDTSTGLDSDILFEKLIEMQKETSDLHPQIAQANAYAYLLDHVQLAINEHTPFSVKINLGVNYSYFASWDVFDKAVYRKHLPEMLRKLLPKECAKAADNGAVGLGYPYTDFWHTVPDWNYLIKHGFAGILKNAQEAKERLQNSENHSPDRIRFLDSVIICYQAILRLLNRIYEYSLSFDVPQFSTCIKNLMQNPPQTLYEVMQFSVLYLYVEEIGPERARTLGPIDRLYLPFLKKSLAEGETIDEIKDLFRYYFLHFTATKRYAEQPFTMCGSDDAGNDLTNELSHLILETYDELNIYDPKIHIRYHKNLDDRILTKALAMIRGGNSSICLINDEVVYQGYEKIGIPRSDAQHYVILGCYEPIIMGMEEGEIAPNRFNMVKCLELALNSGKDIQTGKQIGYESPLNIECYEDFYDIFIRHLDDALDFDLDFIQKQGEHSVLVHPSPIYSSSFEDCIEKGMDVHEYPLKYNNLSLKPFGLATVVDSLVAIKKYVFDKQVVSFAQMRQAILSDWKGYEDLQNTILNDSEKYGNNCPLPDDVMVRLTKHLEARYCGKELARGGRLRLGLDSVYHCVSIAEKTAATPDGRHAGKPVSKNLCAVDGMDRAGITGYIQSLLKIDSSGYVDATVLDFILHPSAVEGEKGLRDFKSLIKVYLDNGGFAIQGNIVSRDTLIDAQQHPEKYATLQVRVCGWNEYFVKLNKTKQDMFIKQCEVSG
jgi:formate C-acetyltransferase